MLLLLPFGIYPDRAATGYGCLEFSESANKKDTSKPISLRDFIEKRPKYVAEKMLQCGKHLWNSGIFLLKILQF